MGGIDGTEAEVYLCTWRKWSIPKWMECRDEESKLSLRSIRISIVLERLSCAKSGSGAV